MPPKAKTTKKREEVVEIPKPHLLPDGPKTWFIGGWSKLQSLTALQAIAKTDPGAQSVYVLPGTISEGLDKETVVQLPPIQVLGLTPAARASLVGRQGGEGAGGDGEGGDAAGSGEAAGETEADPAEAKGRGVTAVADRSITMVGHFRLEGLPPPEPVAAPVPEPTPEAAPKAPAKAGTKGKTAVVKEDPAEVAAREQAAALLREKAAKEKEKGVNPAKWPTVELNRLFFEGSVVVKGVHINFVDCHFASAPSERAAGASAQENLLSVHQYCKVTLTRCTFSAPLKAGLYLYQKSNVTVTQCAFSGGLLWSSPQEGEATSARQSSVGLYVDDAKVTASQCVFEKLGVGALLHDRCDESVLEKSSLNDCVVTGVQFRKTTATLRDSTVGRCGYYGLCFEGKCTGKVLRNRVDAAVKVGEGAAPLLHSNTFSTRLIDLNDKGTIALQPKY